MLSAAPDDSGMTLRELLCFSLNLDWVDFILTDAADGAYDDQTNTALHESSAEREDPEGEDAYNERPF